MLSDVRTSGGGGSERMCVVEKKRGNLYILSAYVRISFNDGKACVN